MCCGFVTTLQKATADNLIGRAFYSEIGIAQLLCNESFGTFRSARQSTTRGSRSFAMKKILLAVSAVALALSAGSAMAADLPYRKEAPVYVPPPPPPMWTGFYAGLNIGGGWGDNNASSDQGLAFLTAVSTTGPCNNGWGWGCGWGGGNNNNWTPVMNPATGNIVFVPGNPRSGSSAGVVGGGQIGYNYQFSSWLLIGAEADIQGTSISGGGGLSLPWFGTVRGRAGFLATPTLLLYGTAGFAYGGVSDAWTGYSNTRTGWTAGGGVEWMFMPNWSAKLEYLFMDLDSGGATGQWTGFQFGYHDHPQVNIVRAGINYHFNWGAPAPVVAKY
jgi:outer membrane immunogenic protein